MIRRLNDLDIEIDRFQFDSFSDLRISDFRPDALYYDKYGYRYAFCIDCKKFVRADRIGLYGSLGFNLIACKTCSIKYLKKMKKNS